jgi:WD40 repeat protein
MAKRARRPKPARGTRLNTSFAAPADATDLAVATDGTRIAGVGADGSLHLWHTESGRHLLALDGHEGPLWGVAFSADGRSILTGSDDGTARAWGLSSAELHRQRLGVRR